MSSKEYVRFETVDFHGISRSKTIPYRNKDSKVFLYAGAPPPLMTSSFDPSILLARARSASSSLHTDARAVHARRYPGPRSMLHGDGQVPRYHPLRRGHGHGASHGPHAAPPAVARSPRCAPAASRCNAHAYARADAARVAATRCWSRTGTRSRSSPTPPRTVRDSVRRLGGRSATLTHATACDAHAGRTISRVICEQEDYDAVPGDGKMQMANPRTVLKTQLEALKAFGGKNYELFSAHELEFTLMKKKVGASAVGDATPGTTNNTDDWEPASDGIDFVSTLHGAKTADFQYELQESMYDMGVDIGTMNAEYGDGQLEITYAPSWGLQSGDNTFTYKNGPFPLPTSLRAQPAGQPAGGVRRVLSSSTLPRASDRLSGCLSVCPCAWPVRHQRSRRSR